MPRFLLDVQTIKRLYMMPNAFCLTMNYFTPFNFLASSCGDGWLGNIFVDKCYKVIFPAIPFVNAVERCVQEGGRLAFVESELESRLLLMLIAKSQNEHYRPGKSPQCTHGF